MIFALLLGELIADPVKRTSSAGKTYGTATIRSGTGSESILIGLVAFIDTACGKLLELRKGDSLAATGVMEQNLWTDREGGERRGWRMTASGILTAYEAGKRRNATLANEANES